jgi:hypothetical protein
MFHTQLFVDNVFVVGRVVGRGASKTKIPVVRGSAVMYGGRGVGMILLI